MLGRLNVFKSKKTEVYLDPRLVKKILQSDLFEFIEKRVDILTGKKMNIFHDMPMPSDPIRRFFVEIGSICFGVLSRQTLESATNLTEEQKLLILPEGHDFTFGPPPQLYAKCIIWNFMCLREQARMMFLLDKKKLSLEFGKHMANYIHSYQYIDWKLAIQEFWLDESLKNYDCYFLVNCRSPNI